MRAGRAERRQGAAGGTDPSPTQTCGAHASQRAANGLVHQAHKLPMAPTLQQKTQAGGSALQKTSTHTSNKGVWPGARRRGQQLLRGNGPAVREASLSRHLSQSHHDRGAAFASNCSVPRTILYCRGPLGGGPLGVALERVRVPERQPPYLRALEPRAAYGRQTSKQCAAHPTGTLKGSES